MMLTISLYTLAFLAFCVISAYMGFADLSFSHDKIIHFGTFFFLALAFYWALDASRKKCINMTVVVVVLGLGIGSEFVQGLLPVCSNNNKRILCN